MKAGPHWIVRKKRLKAWAKANRVTIPRGFHVSTPYCGSACRELMRRVEVRAFGKSSGAWSGRLAKLVTPRLTPRDRIVKYARAEVGVKESPPNSNDGPRVREYQATTGAYKAPWCASWVTWVYRQAGIVLRGFNTAYVPSYVQSAKAGRNGLRLVAVGDVRPGDLVCFDWQDNGESDHIGIVVSPPRGGPEFVAIEGNTAIGNDSNGGQVMERTRRLSDVSAFIRVEAAR